MKKVTKILLAVAVVASVAGCKKGPEDPSISLKSRSARLVGTWELTGMQSDITSNEVEYDNYGTTSEEKVTSNTTTSTVLSGSSVTSTTTTTMSSEPKTGTNYSATQTVKSTFTLAAEWTIEKEGLVNATSTEGPASTTTTLSTTPSNTCSTGGWDTPGMTCDGTYISPVSSNSTTTVDQYNWTWKSSDDKNDYIEIDGTTYQIVKLASKEMILKSVSSTSNTYSSVKDAPSNKVSDSNSTTTTLTFTKK